MLRSSIRSSLAARWAVVLVACLALVALCGRGLANDSNAQVVLKDSANRQLDARILTVDRREVLVERASPKAMLVLPYDDLSKDSQEVVIEWLARYVPGPLRKDLQRGRWGDVDPVAPDVRGTLRADGRLSPVYYSRSKKMISEGVEKLRQRVAPAGFSSMHFSALTELNVLRYLCGVAPDVKLSPVLNARAQEAAEACHRENTISHELGHFTDSVNIAMGNPSLPDTIRQYVDDAGEANREARGHRYWCLKPEMQETGFGMVAGNFSTMWVLSLDGRKANQPFAYPGKGFFPKEFVYGNAWSLYLPKRAPSSMDLNVEVYRLKQRPSAEVPIDMEIPGERLEIQHVSTFESAINFEPSPEPINDPGVYFVRITGGGLEEQYVVELF